MRSQSFHVTPARWRIGLQPGQGRGLDASRHLQGFVLRQYLGRALYLRAELSRHVAYNFNSLGPVRIFVCEALNRLFEEALGQAEQSAPCAGRAGVLEARGYWPRRS